MKEFARIQRLRNVLPCRTGRFGIGDDAAILRTAGAISTDTMVEDVHFRLTWSDWSDVGYKLVASNVSDILAMGAIAESCLFNFALPTHMTEHQFDDFLHGIKAGIEDWCPTLRVCGGDTTSVGEAKSVLSMTVIGRPVGDQYWFRGGARVGDRLWLDGPIGLASAGLVLLKESVDDARSEAESLCVECHRRPAPPDWIRLAAQIEHEPTASIDVSDGLVADIGHVLASSGITGALLHPKLPGWATLRTVFDEPSARRHQFCGGDDYVRVVSSQVSPGMYWTEIGVLTDDRDGVWFQDDSGEEYRWSGTAGYEHFSDGR